MSAKRPQSAKQDSKTIQVRDREDKALALRKAGASYPQIARELNYGTKGGAQRAVHRALGRLTHENAEGVYALTVSQCDQAILEADQIIRANLHLVATYDKATGMPLPSGGSEGKSRIVDRAQGRRMQAMELKCRLAGLFKEKKEISGPGGGPIPIATATVNLEDVLAIGADNAAADPAVAGELLDRV